MEERPATIVVLLLPRARDFLPYYGIVISTTKSESYPLPHAGQGCKTNHG